MGVQQLLALVLSNRTRSVPMVQKVQKKIDVPQVPELPHQFFLMAPHDINETPSTHHALAVACLKWTPPSLAGHRRTPQ